MFQGRLVTALVVSLTLSALLAGCFAPAPQESTRIEPPAPKAQPPSDEPVKQASNPPQAPSNSTRPPPSSAPPQPTPAPPKVPGPFTFVNDVQGCQEVLLLVPVDLGAAQALLPANYTAGRLLDLVATIAGLPVRDVPVDKGAVVWNSLSCAGSVAEGGPTNFAHLAVYVHTPNVTGERDPVAMDLYEVGLFSPSARLAGLLRPIGYPITLAIAAPIVGAPQPLDMLPASPAMTGATDVSDADGVVAHAEGAGAGAIPFATNGRLWTTNPNGTTFTEFNIPATPAFVGATVACAFRDGSAFASTMGFAACTLPTDALMITMPNEDVAISFTWMPGAFPAGQA